MIAWRVKSVLPISNNNDDKYGADKEDSQNFPRITFSDTTVVKTKFGLWVYKVVGLLLVN